MSLTWADHTPETIEWLVNMISPVLFVTHIFEASECKHPRFILRGMICFTLGHYIAFFFSIRRNVWIQFDDTQVKYIKSWESVCNKMLRGRIAPTVLFYESAKSLDSYKDTQILDCIGTQKTNRLMEPEVYFESYEDSEVVNLGGLVWGARLREREAYKRNMHRCCVF